jgi:hypothetical protein
MYIAWCSYDNRTLKQSNEKFVFLLYDNLTQVVKFKIKLGLSFMVPDCVYKFQIICFKDIKLVPSEPCLVPSPPKSRAYGHKA